MGPAIGNLAVSGERRDSIIFVREHNQNRHSAHSNLAPVLENVVQFLCVLESSRSDIRILWFAPVRCITHFALDAQDHSQRKNSKKMFFSHSIGWWAAIQNELIAGTKQHTIKQFPNLVGHPGGSFESLQKPFLCPSKGRTGCKYLRVELWRAEVTFLDFRNKNW